MLRTSTQAPIRQPTITVAAADSSARGKRAADFVCSGVDDQEQIQSAIDRAAENRVTVLLLGGEFLVRGTINLESNVTLEGVGPESVIHLDDGYDLDRYTWRARVHTPIVLANGKENVTIRNLRVTGNTSEYEARAQVGIAFHDCDHCLAEGCHADAINYFPGDVIDSDNGGYGIGTFASRHVTIRGGRYEGSGYENLRIDFQSESILVDGVLCGGGNRTSIQLISGAKHIRIVNSSIIQDDPNAFSALTMHSGIGVAGGGSIEDVIVRDCVILGTLAAGQDHAINIFTNGAQPKNIRVINNFITCNFTAIRFRGEQMEFIGNTITAGQKGITSISPINGAKIVGNKLTCGDAAIRISDGGTPPVVLAAIEIVDNEIDAGASPAVSIRSVSSGVGWKINGNVVRSSVSNAIGINAIGSSLPRASCRGNRTIVQGAGIRIAPDTPNATGWIVAENDVTESAGIELNSGTHIYRDNIGYVTQANGTATINDGNTSIVVTHGLNRTPALKDISVTPTNSLGDASKFWISSVGATQFTINVDADPGATTATFAWSAEIKP